MGALRRHVHRMATRRRVLRPVAEYDWPTLQRWNQDPRVLAFWDNGSTEPWPLDKLQGVYRGISKKAFMFVIELGGRAIGEGGVQELNLPEILKRFPGQDLRRIDLSLGKPGLWGQGLGTEAVGALVRFGFATCRANALVARHISDDNPRSRRVFEKHGFLELGPAVEPPSPGGGPLSRHFILTRAAWLSKRSPPDPS